MRRTALIIPTVAVAGLALLAGCSSGGDSCLVGSWEPADMSEYEVGEGASFDFTLKFDDDKVSINAKSTMDATDYSEAMEMELAYEGKYSVSDGTIKITDWEGSSTLNGEEQTDDSSTLSMSEGESTYSCSGDTLTVDGEDYAKK